MSVMRAEFDLVEGDAASRHVFAESARELHRHGLCVLPIGRDRKPCVAGFQTWRRRPSSTIVAKWVDQHFASNIAIVPGLSNVIVADSDDAKEDAVVEELLGPTPLKVMTRRGWHRYYRQPDIRLPTDLRPYGLTVDLKADRSLVIAPPSVHESGVLYQLDGCDWSALKKLPPPNIDALKRLIEKSPKNGGHSPDRLRDGSRGQWLNDRLCRDAPYCSTLNELLDIADELNSELPEIGYSPLDARELVRRTQKVWRDVELGKLTPRGEWTGSGSNLVKEIDLLSTADARRGPYAFMLLAKLRKEHAARCRRGEAFSITPTAMMKSNVISGWTRETYEKARNLLVETGLIVRVSVFRQTSRGRVAAQYALAGTRAADLTNPRGRAVDRSH